MKSILLIEDDEIKGNSIIDFIKTIKGNKIKVRWKKSWQSGLLEIFDNMIYDYILLDMSMPRYDSDIGDINEEFEPFAGKELLFELKRKRINIPVCVITSFEFFGKNENYIDANNLNDILNTKFNLNYKGMIFYSYSDSTWKEKLLHVLEGEVL